MSHHHSSHMTQKNKPFKGNKGKKKVLGRIDEEYDRAPITRTSLGNHSKQQRHQMANDLRKKKWNDLINKRRGLTQNETSMNNSMIDYSATSLADDTAPPKVVALLGANKNANTHLLRQQLTRAMLDKNEEIQDEPDMENSIFNTLLCPLSAGKGALGNTKQRFTFVEMPRERYSILDIGKVADIVLVVMSCEGIDPQVAKSHPEQIEAFDDFTLQMLTMLRHQGMPKIIGVLQDLHTVSPKKQTDIKKLFHRFFITEFTEDDKFLVVKDINDVDSYNIIVRSIAVCTPSELAWRNSRGYMLSNRLQYDAGSGVLQVEGYLRGAAISANQLMHITGHGDYQIERIELVQDPTPTKNRIKKAKSRKGSMDHTTQDTSISSGGDAILIETADENRENLLVMNEPDAFHQEQTFPTEEELIGAHKHIEQEMEGHFVENGETIGGDIDTKMGEDDWEDDDDEEEEEFDPAAAFNQMPTAEDLENKKKKFDIEARSKEEMDFPDEVDTPVDQPAKTRFQKYRALKSWRTSPWDFNENLPEQYSRIYRFHNIQHSTKRAMDFPKENGVTPYGAYCRVTLIGVAAGVVESHPGHLPMVLSSLFPHEHKLSVIHYKMKRSYHSNAIIPSKTLCEFHCGFKRFSSKPIFSEDTRNDKAKYQRFFFHGENASVASIYGQIMFGSAPVLMFLTKENEESEFVATGQFMSANPNRLIIKRIILTGYPFRIHKRKSVVRFMFFNPHDISYFRPVELRTKCGLRGHIKESLGTHGYMKCVFSDFVKHHDTICMNLYKRVYPIWFPATWGDSSASNQQTLAITQEQTMEEGEGMIQT